LGAYFRIRESEDIQLIVFLRGDMVSDTEEDSGGIKTPKQLITVLLLAIVFPIAIVVMLAQYATGGISVDKNDSALTDESVAKRLKPVGELVMASDLRRRMRTRDQELFRQHQQHLPQLLVVQTRSRGSITPVVPRVT
jgi:hypothetical protein